MPPSRRPIIRAHLNRPAASRPGPCPEGVADILSEAAADAAWAEIASWPGYAPTPLRSLDVLAERLGIAALHYKDEAERFGLGSFKALGGSYAVLRHAADWLAEWRPGEAPSLASIREGAHAEALADLTVVTATDGNHGRSVAWGARMAGCRCRIYIHAGVSEGRREAMAALGAEVARIDGDYDTSVRLCAREAAANGWTIISDTSFEGYMEIPRTVMAGYTVMASEILDQLDRTGEAPPTHVFVQAGVGGVAAAVCARFWQRLGPKRPRFVVVEPEQAACCFESALGDRPAAVAIEAETVMAGLSCGKVSLLAWEVLARGASDFLTIGDERVGPVMRLLAAGEAGGGPITAGESAVPGLIGLIGAAADETLARALGLAPESRVLVLGCEGATDPAIHRAMMIPGPDDPPALPAAPPAGLLSGLGIRHDD